MSGESFGDQVVSLKRSALRIVLKARKYFQTGGIASPVTGGPCTLQIVSGKISSFPKYNY